MKVATGKVCAISGDGWVDHLNSDPQDYMVVPEQPWLDGYCVKKGVIRQFVAMPLGQGYTVEEQLTGAGRHCGIQIAVYPMKAERYAELESDEEIVFLEDALFRRAPADMGLAPGGRMRQHIEQDPYGLDAWDQRHRSRCFFAIANSAQWKAITGERPPTEPPTARDYTACGLPWFEYYGGDLTSIPGSEKLKDITGVAQRAQETGKEPLPHNETIDVPHVIPGGGVRRRPVREAPTDWGTHP